MNQFGLCLRRQDARTNRPHRFCVQVYKSYLIDAITMLLRQVGIVRNRFRSNIISILQ